MKNAASQGTLNGDRLEIPVTVSVKLPQTVQTSATMTRAGSSDKPIHGVSAEVTCTEVCYHVPPADTVCVENCETTIIVKE